MTHCLTIRMLSFWRAGTGKGIAGSLDATCQRDTDGLPIIPGKHLKGLIRDAVRLAHEFGWHGIQPYELFGQGENSFSSLRVDSARLAAKDREAFIAQPDLIACLFTTKRSTAIDSQTGTALSGSLRFEEVAVPIDLEARIIPLEGAPEGWTSALSVSLPLLRSIGAGRTRGLGRAIVSLTHGDET